ncbi:MAG: hypothetical protein IJJ41_10105 [Clostridia bacterium]|nr:hypothetical protein [Clostridia bacterium]
MATKTDNAAKKTIRLFQGKGYEAPVQVWLNGVRYSVPRGKDVEVPAGVAEIIEHSQQQKNEEMVYLSKENN